MRPANFFTFLLTRLLAACGLAAVFASATASAQTPPVVSAPLTYERALNLATSRNLGLEAARRQRAIREAAIRTARQAPNPSASIEVSKDTPHQAFTFDLPVELGGKRRRRIDLATEELTLADVDVQSEMRAVRRELRQAFYSLVASDERVRLSESVLDIARRVRDAAQGRFEAGAAPRLEVLQADLGVTRAETEVELARSTRSADQSRLNAVLDLPPQQPQTIAGSLSEGATTIDFEQALTLATASNVDLIALDRQIAIEQRRVDLLRAERVPTPVLSVSALFNNPPDFTVGPRAAVSVDLPIFSRNQGPIAEAVAAGAQLRGRRDATRRGIENAVYGTIARIEAQRRQIAAYEQRLVPTATDLETLAEESYRAGRTSVLGVFDAQRSLRDLTREALQAALDLQLSLADLEEILGTSIQ
jgi:cobalt-zinc-cadmium efflux system outer membrane protein